MNSSTDLFPFLKLQVVHEATRLSAASVPPLLTGATWSIEFAWPPQYMHLYSSRFNTSARILRHL